MQQGSPVRVEVVEHPRLQRSALHLAANYRLVRRRAAGQPGNLPTEEDWPPVPTPATAQRWNETIEELRTLNQDLRRAILAFAENRLDQEIAPGHSDAYAHFAGMSQHDAYHAGQIALLRRAVAASSRT